MKLKSHSGAKKRIIVKKSGMVMMRKSSKRHLLVNKSKKQKKKFPVGMPLTTARFNAVRRMLPGRATPTMMRKRAARKAARAAKV